MGTQERVVLKRSLNPFEIVIFAFGAVVGWGWIMNAGYWVNSAGTLGAILAFIIAGIFCSLIGMGYAELTPALPLAGGELVFAYRAGGYMFGWITAWAMCFGYVAVAAWEGPAFGSALDYLVHFPKVGALYTIAGYDVYTPWLIASIIGTILIVTIHLLGMSVTAIVNTIAGALLVVAGIMFCVGGVALGDAANAQPLFTGGSAGIVAVLLMAPAMYVGFDVIPQAIEEMENISLKSAGKMVLLAIILGTVWYIMMMVGIAFGAPSEFTLAADIPVADVAAYAFGSPIFGSLVIIGGLGGILTSWNAMYLGASRIMFAMSRARMLPPIFGKLHPKYGSPYASIILTGILGLAGCFLGKNSLGWFVDASSFGVVVAYTCVSISFYILKNKEPELERPFRAPGGRVLAVLAIIASIIFVLLYTPVGRPLGLWNGLGLHEWLMVILWVVIGCVLYPWARKHYKNVSIAEREYMVFGEKYARPEYLKMTDKYE